MFQRSNGGLKSRPSIIIPLWRSVSTTLTEASNERFTFNDDTDDAPIDRLRRAARFGQTLDVRYTQAWNYEECREALERWKSSEDFSPDAVTLALRVLVRCKYDTPLLSKELQSIEKIVGSVGQTPLTDELSLHLLKANGLAGHVGRALSLLSLRQKRGFDPVKKEFEYAVQSILSASLDNRKNRNIYINSNSLDNPTRFLDAILLNMHQRKFDLTPDLALSMLSTYASSPMGKALHFHYKTKWTKDGPRLVWNQPAPYYKIPSQIQPDQDVALKGSSERKPKLEFELGEKYGLRPALSFFESLLHGACGHAPVTPTLQLYNCKIKICCYRGAIWRAMEILDEELPQAGLEPNTLSYLRILEALARLGDITTMKKFFTSMIQRNVPLSRHVVRAMVDGYLNTSDVAGSITFVQDVYNQYSILPPYNTHLKILEMALGSGNPYEATRHVYFLQQLWRFQPNDYHSGSLQRQVRLTVQHPSLSKAALQHMFQYFGYRLEEKDFFDEFRS